MKKNKIELKELLYENKELTYCKELADEVLFSLCENIRLCKGLSFQKIVSDKAKCFCFYRKILDVDFFNEVNTTLEEVLFIDDCYLFSSLKDVVEQHIKQYAISFLTKNEGYLCFNAIATIANEQKHCCITKDFIEKTQKYKDLGPTIQDTFREVFRGYDICEDGDCYNIDVLLDNISFSGVKNLKEDKVFCLDDVINSEIEDFILTQKEDDDLLRSDNLSFYGQKNEYLGEVITQNSFKDLEGLIATLMKKKLTQEAVRNKEKLTVDIITTFLDIKDFSFKFEIKVKEIIRRNPTMSIKEICELANKQRSFYGV